MQAFGAIDYSVRGAAASRPRGGALSGRVGYGHLLWGKKEQPEDFLYGFFRPQVEAQTSVLVNRIDANLSLYPISFLGFIVGHYKSYRSTKKFDTVDCEVYQCTGLLSSTYVKARFITGYAGFFAGASARLDLMNVALSSRPFVDETSALIARARGDRLRTFETYGGYQVLPQLSFGFYGSFSHMLYSGGRNDSESLFARYVWNAWQVSVGGGFYRSSTQPRDVTGWLLVQWTGKPSLEAF